MSSTPIRVVVWDENPSHAPQELYPGNIRTAVGDGLREVGGDEVRVTLAHQDEPEQGVTPALLAETDVLLWWGHVRHHDVKDDVAELIRARVCEHGLGFIGLHSAHYSKPFNRILDCEGHLNGGWRDDDPAEEIRVCAPQHPIAAGIADFTLPGEEMYGAPFEVPPPEVVIFQSFFPKGGEYFPSGLVWTVGKGIKTDFTSGPGRGVGRGKGIGRVFYFRPGHEANPTYHDANVKRILMNAVRWAAKRDA